MFLLLCPDSLVVKNSSRSKWEEWRPRSDLPVIPWTVNTTAEMERLVDVGRGSILTDYATPNRDG